MKPTACMLALLFVLTVPAVALAQAPTLTITEPLYGAEVFMGVGAYAAEMDVVAGHLLEFSWSATPGGGTSITDYRYGWDIVDAGDDADPGWSAWGAATSASGHVFFTGMHTFTVETRNNLGVETRGVIVLTIVPGPVPTDSKTWGAIKSLYR